MDGIINFRDSAVIHAKDFVKPCDHRFFTALTLRTLLLNEVIDGITFRFVLDKTLHDLKAGLAQIAVSSFGYMPFGCIEDTRLVRRRIGQASFLLSIYVMETIIAGRFSKRNQQKNKKEITKG